MTQVRSSARQRTGTVIISPTAKQSPGAGGRTARGSLSGLRTKQANDENTAPLNFPIPDTCFDTPSKRLKSKSPVKPLGRSAMNQTMSTEDDERGCFEIVVEQCEPAKSKSSNPDLAVKSEPNEIIAQDRFHAARKLFHKSAKTRIIGRSQERASIEDFWQASVVGKSSEKRILYVCGTPGTGKSALLSEMLPGLSSHSKDILIIERNCMMFEDSSDILVDLYRDISGKKSLSKVTGAKKKEAICKEIQKSLASSKQSIVLVLDEIDELAKTDLALLGNIFHWAADPSCSLAVIGVANSIDLMSRHVPGFLQGQTKTLYFCPYQIEDITAILTDRLNRANQTCKDPKSTLILPVAIELCSKKVAGTGDLRKALEIMQIAFDMAAAEPNCLQIQFKHVLAAMTKAFSTNTVANITTGKSGLVEQLNMNARMILVSLLLFQDENPAPVGTRLPYKKPTMQNIYDRYASLLCSSGSRTGSIMETVSRDEFMTLLASLETFNLVSLTAASGPSSAAANRRKSFSSSQDWQSSVIKLNVSDRAALIAELKAGAITRLFL